MLLPPPFQTQRQRGSSGAVRCARSLQSCCIRPTSCSNTCRSPNFFAAEAKFGTAGGNGGAAKGGVEDEARKKVSLSVLAR